MNTPYRIGIDCRLAGPTNAGIGRYIDNLIANLPVTDDVEWVFFTHDEQQLQHVCHDLHHTIVLAPIRHYTMREQLQMPSLIAASHVQLLHVPHFNIPLLYRGKLVVTIHDLLWHEQQGAHVTTLSPLQYALKYRAYRYVATQAIVRSASIIVPSKTIAGTVQRYVPTVDAKKIQVIYEGVDESWFQAIKPKKREPILFYTGSLYPHKNVMQVVHALKSLPMYTLMISSSRNVFVEDFMHEVQTLGLQDRVQYLGALSDAELKAWYQRVSAVVQPSKSEGFGLTGLEAMAAGALLIASDIDIFHEIYTDHFLAFDPDSVDAFVTAVGKVEKINTSALQKAQQHAHTFTWQQMAEQTYQTYISLLQ